MARYLLTNLLAVALMATIVGCSTTPLPETKPATRGYVGFATLAPAGSFEAEAAPAYTRLALLRHNAAKALRADKITVAQARDIQGHADTIRKLLDGALAEDRDGRTFHARDRLHEAHRLLDAAEKLLKGSP